MWTDRDDYEEDNGSPGPIPYIPIWFLGAWLVLGLVFAGIAITTVFKGCT